MDRTRQPIERLALSDETLRFAIIDVARIRKLGSDLLVVSKLRQRRFIANRQQQLFPPFFAAFWSSEDPHSWRALRQFTVVTINILRVGQLVWRSHDVPEDFVRGRHLVGGW